MMVTLRGPDIPTLQLARLPARTPERDARQGSRMLGVAVFGASAIALGLVGLAWGDFAAVWQPVPAGMPGRTVLAYLTALAFIESGAGLLLRRRARHPAIVLAALYGVFAVLWLPRVFAHPLSIGTWNGVFEQLALVAACIMDLATRLTSDDFSARVRRGARVLFGLCLLSFGATHFAALQATADLVQTWLPPSARFWAAATRVFHIAAGTAVLIDVAAVLATRLFTTMLVGFGALVWAPRLLANAHVHQVWAGNAVNFTLIGGAWLMADAIASAKRDGKQ